MSRSGGGGSQSSMARVGTKIKRFSRTDSTAELRRRCGSRRWFSPPGDAAHNGEDERSPDQTPARPRQPIPPACIKTNAMVNGDYGEQDAGNFLVFVPLRDW